MSLTERLSVDAIRDGWANTDHYDNLADCRNLLMLAACEKQDTDAMLASELGYHALSAIKERQELTGEFKAEGDELAALVLLVDKSEKFWTRQSGALFERHYNALKSANQQSKQVAAAKE